MRRLGIVAVGLALAVGIVVGGMVGNPFDGKASASTASQAREDQMTIFTEVSFDHAPQIDVFAYQPIAGASLMVVAPDAAHYPPSSTFRLEGVWHAARAEPGDGDTICLRLFDRTASAPVVGSEVCHTSFAIEDVRARSLPFSLPAGEHEYTLEAYCGPGPYSCLTYLTAARLIVEWGEPFAVGGIAELPALAGTGGSGMGGATYAVLAGAAAGVLAFAVLATLTVKKRGVR